MNHQRHPKDGLQDKNKKIGPFTALLKWCKSATVKQRLPQAALWPYSQFQHLYLGLLIPRFLEGWVDWMAKKKSCLHSLLMCWTSAGLILCSCPGREPDPSGSGLWTEQEKDFWQPHKQYTLGQGKAQKIPKCPVLLSHMDFVTAKIKSIQQSRIM